MIGNASKTSLSANPGILPSMINPIQKWSLPISFIRVTKTVIDGEVKESESCENFFGSVQNLDFKSMTPLPEGQRSWSRKMIHSLINLRLNTDDIIKYEGVRYRVMNIRDFKEYGFLEYHVVEDYKSEF